MRQHLPPQRGAAPVHPHADVVGGQSHLAGDRRQRDIFHFRLAQQASGFRRKLGEGLRETVQRAVDVVVSSVPLVISGLGVEGVRQPGSSRVAAVTIEQGVAQRDPEPGVHLARVGQPARRQGHLESEFLQDVLGVFGRAQPFDEVAQMRRTILAETALDEAANFSRRRRGGSKPGVCGRCSPAGSGDEAL